MSTATSDGRASVAVTAATPSPVDPATPVPAMVLTMLVLTVTLRILLFEESAIYMFPFVSTATPFMLLNEADNAGPLSPLNPTSPFPATVVMIPVLAVTLRTTLLSESPMK